ncbi:MAG: class I SAM-dependent RNA methyltransferase [Anaeromyxobacter sp.]
MEEIIDIEELAPGGEGVARQGARPVFVPCTAPGDRVRVRFAAGEGAAHAELLEVVRPGPARIAASCPHFGLGAGPGLDAGCGGCEWQHVDYGLQLEAKVRTLTAALQRIGRFDPAGLPLRPIVPSPASLRYRSRAKFHLDRASGGLVFFRRRSHEPVRLRTCHLLEPGLDALREVLGPALVAARLPAHEVALEWSEAERRGAALLRVPEVTAALRERSARLLEEVPALAGLVLQAEAGPPALVGDPVLRLARDPARPEAGLQRTRPDVFQQANRGANAALVEVALRLLRPEGADVLELHCGAGNFTGALAARARAVAAVEVQGPALELARADQAERRGGAEVRFFGGDALKLALALARERGPAARRFDAVLLDPPRDGAKGIGPALRELGVSRAVYVSCDPATFARDLRACAEAGFALAEVVPVDMFPMTHHVEGVALLVK